MVITKNEYLDGLSVLPEDIDTNNRLVKVGVCALRNVIIKVFLVAQCVHAFEDELEKSLQVFWARTCDKDVGVTMCEGCCNSQAQSGGLATATAGSQCHG